jgi:hypothetical protein
MLSEDRIRQLSENAGIVAKVFRQNQPASKLLYSEQCYRHVHGSRVFADSCRAMSEKPDPRRLRCSTPVG